jgi:hypothetical protein
VGDIFDQLAKGSPPPVQAAQPNQTAQTPATGGGDIFDQLAAGTYKDPNAQQNVDTGEQINDVGNPVTVPKEGESFSDTIRRGVARYQQMTPDQRQQAISKETATIPAKVAEMQEPRQESEWQDRQRSQAWEQ